MTIPQMEYNETERRSVLFFKIVSFATKTSSIASTDMSTRYRKVDFSTEIYCRLEQDVRSDVRTLHAYCLDLEGTTG